MHGKHDAQRWHDLVRPVSDALRERQRDALVAYLVARDGRRDATDLYESHLIDVQVTPCLVTTRVLQAIGAVQLFVQRWLLNLERDLAPGDVDRARWEWMKSYRVWEANRKVFLYPENWLLPELRDDKTQAFRQLEGNLGQNEPSPERAIEALAGYLDELSELGQISVVGLYEDDRPLDGTVTRVVYAVGRSPNQPYHYFWRRCERFGADAMQWSGWERIDVEIPGDHILPFVFEGDLHIAWPVIRQHAAEGSEGTFEVQLAWVRRTPGGWTRRKVSRGSLPTSKIPNRDERSMFAFRVARTAKLPESIQIQCYVTKRDPSLDFRTPPEPKPQSTPATGRIQTVSLVFFSYVEYKNPLAYEAASGVSFQGQGFYEPEPSVGAPAFQQSTVDRPYPLDSLSRDRGGTYELRGFPNSNITLKFLGTVRLPDGSTVTEEQTVEIPQGSSYSRTVNFVFPGGAAPPRLGSAEYPLLMQLDGVFTLVPGEDVDFNDRPGTDDLEPLSDTYCWMSGYREVGATAHGVSIDGTVFKASKDPERFVLLPSGPATGNAAVPVRLWHFQEARSRFYLDLRVSQNVHALTIYPDSYPESGTYRRLATRGLPALFALNSAGLCFWRRGQTCVRMPLGHRTTGGQGVVGSNPAVPTLSKP